MRRYRFLSVVLLCFLTSFSWTQAKQPKPDLRGTLSGDNNYTNPALGMTINLPGEWSMLDMITPTPSGPGCTGPLCGPPDINVVLETKPGQNQRYRLYLSGWKLSAQYLNRNRYSLDWFAGIMLEGSVSNGLVPLEKHKPVRLDGKPGFRLFMVQRGEQMPRIIGYVSEAKGFVFLLVSPTPMKPEIMQNAIEAMKLE